jgi:hypothetical protein
MRNFVTFILLIMMLLFLFGCQKDQPITPKEPQYRITVTEDPTDLDIRSGGHQFVFFENSFTVAHTLLNIYPQYAFNKQMSDSVALFKVLPEIDAEINYNGVSRYCYLYTAVFYNQYYIPITFTVYAPATNGTRRTVIYNNGNWNNDIVYAELNKGSGYSEYFDLSCGRVKRDYYYRTNFYEIDTIYTRNWVLRGNNGCGDLYRLQYIW